MRRFLSLTMLMLVVALPARALPGTVDSTFNVTTYAEEGSTYLLYEGMVDMTDDDEGTHFTAAMFIGDANRDTAFVWLSASDVTGTEDTNVFVEYSVDLLNWSVDSTAAVKDQLSTTAVWDTLNVIAGSFAGGVQGTFYRSTWMRIRFVGQTGNPGTTITWYAYVPKNPGAQPSGRAIVRNSK